MTYGNAAKKIADESVGPWFRWREKDIAKRAIRFIEKFCRSPKGHGHGEPMKLAQFQKEWIAEILSPGVRQAVLQCPRGQGKSTLLAALAVWAVFDRYEDGEPQVPVMATTVGQAKKAVFDVAVKMVRAEPELADRCKIMTGTADNRIVVNDACGGGICFPIANDPDGLQGLDPGPIAVVDEIGFQPVESWTSMMLASGKRSRSVIVAIGTPGLDRDNALWNIREGWLDGKRPPGFSFTEFSAPEGLDPHDEDTWRAACPALDAGYQSIDALRVAIATAPLAHFEIFHLGRWVEGTDCWLGPDANRIWSDLKSDYELVPKELTYVGLDVGLSSDTTAVVVGQYRPDDGVLHTECTIWQPTADGTVDLADIMAHLRSLHREYKVAEIVYDKRLFELPAQMLADEGLPMTDFSQSVERMTPACGEIYAAIMRGEISHNGDEFYKRQILNAVPRFNQHGYTLEKRKSRGKIDAAIALTLMHARAQRPAEPAAPAFVI